MDDVRIIDKTKLGEFLLDTKETGEYKELLENALKNDISNGTFDISLVEKGIRDTYKLEELKDYISQKSLSPGDLDEAIKIAYTGFNYEPTKGAWAIASEQFIKATSSTSKIICITPEANLSRTWAVVEIPTALDYLPDDQIFGGFKISELKSVYNSDGLESVQNMLKSHSTELTKNVCMFYDVDGKIIGADAAYLMQKRGTYLAAKD